MKIYVFKQLVDKLLLDYPDANVGVSDNGIDLDHESIKYFIKEYIDNNKIILFCGDSNE